jgi:hypothetical protein
LSAEVLTLNVLGPGSIPSITEMAKFPKLLWQQGSCEY